MGHKVDTPYHDNDLILSTIYHHKVVDSELEVARNFTWAVLGMEDGNFWHLGGVTRWTSRFFKHTWTSLAIVYVASQLFLCLFWIGLRLKNRWLQHFCFKKLCKIAKASRKSYSNAQHFLSDLLTHSWFHSMLFALPSYHFPCIDMNRCLYLMIDLPLVLGHARKFSNNLYRTWAHNDIETLSTTLIYTLKWLNLNPRA